MSRYLLAILFLFFICKSNALLQEKSLLVEKHLKQSSYRCALCVIAVTIVQNEANDHRQSVEQVLSKVCDYVPVKLNATCRVITSVFGDQVVDAIVRKDNPSKICNDLQVFQCDGCSLNNKPKENIFASRSTSALEDAIAFVISFFLNKKKQSTNVFAPYSDADNDGFSTVHNMKRGADWRGKDCNDTNANIRPGVYDTNPLVDGNCNGIYGKNEQGQSYEDLFCKDSEAKTVVMFGDSAASAFHIPPEWLHLQNVSNLFSILDDELDFPQYSYSTGWAPEINGQSIYLQMRQRNRCNHRDYQSLGHNGFMMHNLAEDQVPALTVSKNSKPFLAFIAYVGNDVCKDTFDEITTPEQFGAGLLKGLDALEAKAPANSKVLVMGLVDGRILWNEMANRIHPLGVTYEQFYSFLSCANTNPCKTWLTSNETLRNATSARAAELSYAAKKVVQGVAGKYQNIEVDYIDCPLPVAIEYCKKNNIPLTALIEPFDGFHPTHFAHRLFSTILWDYLEKNHPDWLGPVNPYNDMIDKKFGEQGGY